MSKKTLVVLVLVLLLFALIYLAGLAGSLHLGGRKDPTLAEIEDSWVKGIDRLLGGFAPKLETQGLRCVDGTPASPSLRLIRDDQVCEIPLRGDPDQDYLKGALWVEEPGVAVYVYNAGTAGKRDPACRSERELTGTLQLLVSYVPNGEVLSDTDCWLRSANDEPVRVVVGTPGGRLRLGCKGCDPGRGREIGLRWE